MSGRRGLRIAMIGTYPPRRCGVAAHAWPLRRELLARRPEWRVDVVAIDAGAGLAYPPEVGAVVRLDGGPDAVRPALDTLAAWRSDLLLLHYEPGIWPSAQLCRLLGRCRIPVVAVLHNVPIAGEAAGGAAIRFLGGTAVQLVAPIQAVRAWLVADQRVPAERVVVLPWPHNGPEPAGRLRRRDARRRLRCEGRRVLFTYGFLGPGKGVDVALRAVALLVPRHPELSYHVVGGVHYRVPDAAAYLAELGGTIWSLGLASHVALRPEHVPFADLDVHMAAADLYLCPHRLPGGFNQTSSGTIPHALRRGRPFVSVPSLYAAEMARRGCGLVAEPAADALAAAMGRLLDDPAALRAMEVRAAAAGRRLSWDRAGEDYVSLIESVAA